MSHCINISVRRNIKQMTFNCMSLVIKLRAKLAGNVDFTGRGMGNFQFSGLRGAVATTRYDRPSPHSSRHLIADWFQPGWTCRKSPLIKIYLFAHRKPGWNKMNKVQGLLGERLHDDEGNFIQSSITSRYFTKYHVFGKSLMGKETIFCTGFAR